MVDVVFVESIKVRRETKERLRRLIGELEAKMGRRISVDEAINYLLDQYAVDTAAFAEAVGIVRAHVKPGELYAELRRGRAEDEGGS